MRLLFDENLSRHLVGLVDEAFPGSSHVVAHDLQEADDVDIWAFARREQFTIVSKDADFYHRAITVGHPPKVVWLRVGNAGTALVASLLKSRRDAIEEFAEDAAASVLIIDLAR